jgi:threonine 3-dehydrogenase
VNNTGVTNVLEAARTHCLRVFSPSTIAVFGPSSPRDIAPDETVMRPTTIYGVTKVHLELLGEYYHSKYGVDFRSLRYPGVISAAAMPGGGTTDYAVEIYHQALATGRYTSFLSGTTALPMIYMPDLLRATSMLMQAPAEALKQRTYNVGAFSFTPEELAASIRKVHPGFEIEYAPDFRQEIATTWPQKLDDSAARRDWGWEPKYDIDSMTEEMLSSLGPVQAEAVEALAEQVRRAAERRERLVRFLADTPDEIKL